VDVPIALEHPRSAFIEDVDDEDFSMLSAGPEPVGDATVQHVDDADCTTDPELSVPPVPRPSHDPDTDDISSDSDDDALPPLGDPEHEFFGDSTPTSISLIGAAAFKWPIDAGEEVYTISIQPTSDHLVHETLRTVGNNPVTVARQQNKLKELTTNNAPTTALHSEPLPTNEGELFAKVIPTEYQDYFNVFSREEAKNLPPHREFDHEIHLENDQTPPHSHIYPLSGTELGLVREFLDDMLGKGFIGTSQSPARAPVLFAKEKDGTLRLCVDF